MARTIATAARDDSVAALCAALGTQLRERATTLAQAVRDYPTPIAACDDQLTDLLERRSRVLEAGNQLQALGVGVGGVEEAASTLAALEDCAETLRPRDLDDAFAARFAESLARLRGQWRGRAGGCGPADAWANDGGTA